MRLYFQLKTRYLPPSHMAIFLTTSGLLNIVIAMIAESSLSASKNEEERMQKFPGEQHRANLVHLREDASLAAPAGRPGGALRRRPWEG